MKTKAMDFTVYGNIGLVQLRSEPESSFPFKPAGPAVKSGGLSITEAVETGVVSRLVALNNTEDFLLLTDADILVGAKQNRIVNRSVLLQPLSKTVIEVSCIERLRWNYNSRYFSKPDNTADHSLRRAKAASMSRMKNESGDNYSDTQGTVWSHISDRLAEEKCNTGTESYHEMVNFSLSSKANEFPACDPGEGCNGLAVLANGLVQSIDIFGTEEVYRYYFPLLRDSAFLMAMPGKDIKPVDRHEAFYKTLETIDSFETAGRNSDTPWSGAGKMTLAENESLIGFELTAEGQLIHQAVFTKLS